MTVAWLATPVSSAAGVDRTQTEAQLLDQAAILCSNCFFGASTYYYCFAANNDVLVGYQKTPVVNWEDKSKNYLTRVHSAWASWTEPSQRIPISYDAKHIWVSREGGNKAGHGFGADLKAVGKWVTRDNNREVRLMRSSERDVFTNDRCRKADQTRALGGP
jgi:hypothetical protein